MKGFMIVLAVIMSIIAHINGMNLHHDWKKVAIYNIFSVAYLVVAFMIAHQM